MTTSTYYFRGKCKWAMVHTMDQEYQTYKINMFLDDTSKELWKESGLQQEPKKAVEGKDDEGKNLKPIDCDIDDPESYIVFRRPDSKTIKGDVVKFGKPKVLDAGGMDTADLIGNDSTVLIKVSTFDTKKGRGHRLEAIKIIDLIPYEGKDVDAHQPEGWEDDVNF